ncbi:MAG: ABC transporter substrate-binding protein [Alphaproteobacteria bacterium]|nr:ABC transporter substrate-binding protein [Alphaproteobacteria bacterium]
MQFKRARIAALMAGAMMAASPVLAEEIRVGLSAEPSALDPYYHNLGPNNQMAQHFFDALIGQDDELRLVPGLATAWKPISDTVWEFKLRPNVKFHDGTPFSAEDVVFSINRVPKVPNTPSPFTIFTRPVKSIKVIDPLTIHIETNNPYPLLPNDMSRIMIMSAKAAAGAAPEGKTTEQLSKGEGLVGTGPFKFVEWVRGDRLVVARNDAYWGGKTPWTKVTFRPLSNNAARVAALLSGGVDVIENPPTTDLKKLRENPNVTITQAISNRVIYIHLDSFRDPTPGIPDAQKNPLKDQRVREALSVAINRDAIANRIMEGLGIPAADFLVYPMFGTRKDTPPIQFNPERARKLLADAGYPNGFSVTLGAPNDRYINDADVAQAVAAMWTRIGVKTQVEAVTRTVFFKNRDEFKYSAYLAGWGAGTGEMSDPLRALVATPNRDKGFGGTNKGRYSNAKVDALLEEALKTVDEKKREKLLQDAAAEAMRDVGLIPIHFEVSPWAAKKGLKYKARADQYTLAHNVVKDAKN